MSFKIPSGSDKVQFSIRIDEEDFNIIEKLSAIIPVKMLPF